MQQKWKSYLWIKYEYSSLLITTRMCPLLSTRTKPSFKMAESSDQTSLRNIWGIQGTQSSSTARSMNVGHHSGTVAVFGKHMVTIRSEGKNTWSIAEPLCEGRGRKRSPEQSCRCLSSSFFHSGPRGLWLWQTDTRQSLWVRVQPWRLRLISYLNLLINNFLWFFKVSGFKRLFICIVLQVVKYQSSAVNYLSDVLLNLKAVVLHFVVFKYKLLTHTLQGKHG